MAYPIEWTDHARRTYLRLIDNYLDLEKVAKAEALINRTDEIVSLISNLPELFPKVDGHPNVRKVAVTYEVCLFYRFQERKVHLVLFWPSLSNPIELEIFLNKVDSSEETGE
jgi:plasmid stabilization system protein ParE